MLKEQLQTAQLEKQGGSKEKFKMPAQPKAIEHVELGKIEQVALHSSEGPFAFAPEHKVALPQSIIAAVGSLVAENSATFSHFVPRNKEGDPLAYQHCIMPGGLVSEPFFQVDMVAVDQDLLSENHGLSADEMTDRMRGNIFEFEPSIAMYELVQTFGGAGSMGEHFRRDLDVLRQRHGKPIAILAPTLEKFAAVLATEFGVTADHPLEPAELLHVVKEASGFDALFGPDEFMKHLEENNGECNFLLYVRPSDPTAKLKDPNVVVNEPLLGNDLVRRIIRQNAITLNIDNPDWSAFDPRKIKDSKVALPLMGMGRSVRSANQLQAAQNETGLLRAKPRTGVFGAYAQKTLEMSNAAHITWLATEIAKRGAYILQPEMAPLMVVDQTSGRKFLAVDRNFFSMVSGAPEFMGGVRVLIPADSQNAQKGRLHGSDDMISVSIIAQ